MEEEKKGAPWRGLCCIRVGKVGVVELYLYAIANAISFCYKTKCLDKVRRAHRQWRHRRVLSFAASPPLVAQNRFLT